MKPTDISFDLETLSTRSDAAIVSIGAVAFDRNTGELGEHFYRVIELDSAITKGHVEGGTLAWWMRQSAEARAVFQTRSTGLDYALGELSGFYNKVLHSQAQHEAICVWGNGATFDISILEHAYRQVGGKAPWPFFMIRDMRTIVEAAEARGFNKRLVAFDGVAHNALDDAAHQAKIISMCWRGVTGIEPTVPWPTSGQLPAVLEAPAVQTGSVAPTQA